MMMKCREVASLLDLSSLAADNFVNEVSEHKRLERQKHFSTDGASPVQCGTHYARCGLRSHTPIMALESFDAN
ncbi:uncharacterized protein PHALS_14909 [Plasmopara halstedii]|uniref:Uncharacterized protein n=1 Tax=Plasmopara halstedii TaxID=4781 RepID=A0A0N7L3R1_PLAHL|nr:uncharacterized protein PHALS_14909 [Plasmopara halstedii]CEG36579.1 hypothetical protein PHALS_14909 [Plasmopara halstedii]|eukprot:XP_024572948.1 hypothetical protein PHALS_14909 [Plasmopara halstedii]